MDKALVFTAYRRPRYFRRVLDAWQRVRGFDDWNPTVYLEPSPVEDQMYALAVETGAQVVLNPIRRGVLSNPWHALDRAFYQGAGFTVLAEDDVLPATDTLEYFTWAADTCRHPDTLIVCASNHADTAAPGSEYTCHRSKRFCPLIWGTWANQWVGVLRDTWDHRYDTGTPAHPQAGWDWNINLRVMGHRHVIVPDVSRSMHIGELHGSHMTPLLYPGSVAATYTAHHDPGEYTIR